MAAPHGPATVRVDGALGRWVVTDWAPPQLSRVVERIWDFDGRTAHRRERVFPGGTLEIIVQLGGRYRDARGAPGDAYPSTCATGLQQAPFTIEAPDAPLTVLGIRLRPQGAFALFGAAVGDLVDRTIDAHDALGVAGRELTERCAAAADGVGRVRAAAAWVLARSREARPIDPAVDWLATAIAASGGGVPIAALRARAGLGKSRSRRAFVTRSASRPKRYARLVRFRAALEALNTWDDTRPLSELALDAGYYDQAHFNGEFRALAGLSPGAFLDAVRYPRSVSVAE